MPKPDVQLLTDEDEARIQQGIAADPDNPEWTAADFARAKSFAEVCPELAAGVRRKRGQQKAPTKRLVSLRLSEQVLAHFRATGPGWQTRIDDALKRAAGL